MRNQRILVNLVNYEKVFKTCSIESQNYVDIKECLELIFSRYLEDFYYQNLLLERKKEKVYFCFF